MFLIKSLPSVQRRDVTRITSAPVKCARVGVGTARRQVVSKCGDDPQRSLWGGGQRVSGGEVGVGLSGTSAV